MDLVFALHTGGGSGAWLFDEQSIGAGETLKGTWALNLLNNANKYSGYSNLTIFGRNYDETTVVVVPPNKVPEPGTPATLALGMAMLGLVARRRKSS
ncbi:PEP-CTERM sorting domain-containing protein [Massilia sp. B-10]|nr:PEP-CTERM sorting domain-containing protein [Massilia sp. B-10]UUZ52821.1 PEP-CTERM sorting domain-containing protein [Massilia sp. H-1]